MTIARTFAALMLALLTSLSLFTVGCAETPQQKADKANAKIDRLNTIDRELALKGFPFVIGIRSTKVPNGMSDTEVAQVRNLLNEYISTGGEVQSLTSDKDVMFFDTHTLSNNISQARSYLSALDGYEAKQKAKKNEVNQLGREIQFLADLADRIKVIEQKISAKSTAIYERDRYFSKIIDPTQVWAEQVRFGNREFIATAELAKLLTLKSDLQELKDIRTLELADINSAGASVSSMGRSSLEKVRSDVDLELKSLGVQIESIETELKARSVISFNPSALRPSGSRKTPDLKQ